MSTTFSLVLVLLLSLHACNARIFEVVHHDQAKEFQFSISKENDQKVNPESVSEQPKSKNSAADLPGEAKNGRRLQGKNKNSEYNKPGKYFEGKNSRVPHRKRQQEPGFNLDYLPPRTHPPVHN